MRVKFDVQFESNLFLIFKIVGLTMIVSQTVFSNQTLCLKLSSSKSLPSSIEVSGKMFQNSGSTPMVSRT